MCFDKIIKIYGFVRNVEEPYIYKWTNNSIVIFLVLYVDDILLIENDILALQSVVIITVFYEEFGRSILHLRDEVLENISQKPIVSLLTVEQPCIIIDLLINKIYF